ncbi:MAG: N-acetyltransferase family protein, partial [Bdellovibrionota bacterium]
MLRLAQLKDATRLSAIFAPYVTETAISFATKPPSAADFERRVQETLPDYPFLVMEAGGQVVAYAYASRHRALESYRWSCEVSIYVDSSFHRRGAGKRLYTALFALLRAQRLHQAYAGITLPNDRSVELHEKFGFRFFARFDAVGHKQGAWRDVGWWSLPLQPDFENPPPEPLSFA